MSNKKDLKFTKLSKARYRELLYFCKQYYEWCDELREMTYVKSVVLDGLPKCSDVSSSTENLVLRKIELEKKIAIVKECAKEASPILYNEILQNVVQGVPYRYLNVPYGINGFYEARRRFFDILSKNKK